MTPRKYRGVVIKESLKDPQLLKDVEVISEKVTSEDDPSERWHIYEMSVSRADIGRLAQNIKSPLWYMHFWQGGEIIVGFQDRLFAFTDDDEATRDKVIKHGLKLGIPREQLDFKIK
ncbi:hypothetical protein ACFL0Z_03165 [Patescibacteria group bacterium]